MHAAPWPQQQVHVLYRNMHRIHCRIQIAALWLWAFATLPCWVVPCRGVHMGSHDIILPFLTGLALCMCRRQRRRRRSGRPRSSRRRQRRRCRSHSQARPARQRPNPTQCSRPCLPPCSSSNSSRLPTSRRPSSCRSDTPTCVSRSGLSGRLPSSFRMHRTVCH